MEAGACSCSYDYDAPEFQTVTWRKARTAHACCECNAPIRPGMRYQLIKGKADGYFYDYATCPTCAVIRHDWRCAPLTGLRDYLRETLGTDYVTGETDDECASGEGRP
jgi:hypothetical protein